MKIVRVEIDDFARIRRARIDLGEGLNVLYGPNDRGKTTVAEAIRAALLLPHGSSYGERFVPWDRDAKPHVRLTLRTGDGRYWRVDKTFARGSGGASLLEASRDGATFTVRAKGREVDGELRALLGWGIAGPGGRGAPRGLPESFLTHALLGPQEDAPALLTKGLDEDSDEAGRQRLTEALQVLAQDEEFKRVLDAATRKVDEAFTPTGKPRRAQGAPLLLARDEVREARRRRDDALAERDLARSVMEEREKLSRDLAAATARRDDAAQLLAARRRAHAQGAALRAARARLEEARADERRLVELRDKHAALQRTRDDLAEQARRRAEAAAEAEVRAAEARERLARAETAVSVATASDAERERALRVRELEATREAARREVDAANAAEDARARREAAERRREAAAAAHREAAEVAEAAAAAFAEAERELGVLERARDHLERERLRARVRALRADADEAARLRREAETLRAEADRTEQALPEVPTEEQLARFEALAQARAVAEARLDVGLSVALRRRPELTVEAEADEAPIATEGDALDLEARRKIRLRLARADGEVLADLVVTGGDPEARAEAERLRERWEAEVVPHLGDASLEALRERAAQVEATRRELVARRSTADEFERRAAELESRRGELEDSERRLADLDAELGPMDLADLDLADADEAALRERRRRAQERRSDAADALERAREELQARGQALAAAERELEVAPKADPSAPSLEAAQRKLASVEASLASLNAERAAAAQRAEAELAEARVAVEAADAAARDAREAREQAAAAWSEVEGRLGALGEQVAAIDEAALREAVERAEAALAALGDAADEEVDEALVAEAERALQAAEEDVAAANKALAHHEGRLEQVGGLVAEERYRAAEEALALAEQRQREIETDYNAYKLLVEAMRASEQEEGAHLGKALAKPVSEALRRLLQQVGGDAARYGALVFGATLAAEGVTALGELRGPEKLSAGTREQIATLLRLTIARHLGAPLILDDHLTHSDPLRVEWFRGALREVAHDTQVLVITCHPAAYLDASELPGPELPYRDRAAGLLRAIDASRVIES